MFLLWLRQVPWCGDWTPASVPPPAEGRSSPTNIPAFPPNSFLLLSFAWFYILFSSDQVLLSAFSWCSACTSVSGDVFLMYPWREMYSTSTYSSTILFSIYTDSLMPTVIRANSEILLLCLHWLLYFDFLSSKFTRSWIFASAYISFNIVFIFLFHSNFITYSLL